VAGPTSAQPRNAPRFPRSSRFLEGALARSQRSARGDRAARSPSGATNRGERALVNAWTELKRIRLPLPGGLSVPRQVQDNRYDRPMAARPVCGHEHFRRERCTGERNEAKG
jgi:hypothetical protein